MKKYFPGLTVIVFALTFSAFTKPLTMMTFKLKTNPVVSGIVNDPAQWTTGLSGQFFGACSGVLADLACTIQLDNLRTSYFHIGNGEIILNTWDYANVQNPKQDYLEISETTSGIGYNRIIYSIIPKTWDSYGNWPYQGGVYVITSLGSSLSFSNAQEIND
jgi:hypothetical protein